MERAPLVIATRRYGEKRVTKPLSKLRKAKPVAKRDQSLITLSFKKIASSLKESMGDDALAEENPSVSALKTADAAANSSVAAPIWVISLE